MTGLPLVSTCALVGMLLYEAFVWLTAPSKLERPVIRHE